MAKNGKCDWKENSHANRYAQCTEYKTPTYKYKSTYNVPF